MVRKNLVNFFKKYGYYVVGGLLLIAIGVTLMSVVNTNPQNGVIDVSSEPLSFRLPMNEVTVLKEYSDTELLWNQTLKQYEAHKAYTITSENLKVFAAARGTVSEVGNTFELGNYVVITHEDGLKSMYASLSEDVLVSVNATVEKGQMIGSAGTTSRHQSEDGNHLYFELYKDNVKINPSTYLNFDIK